MRVGLACAALVAMAFLPVTANAQRAPPAPYDLSSLHPDVRAAVIRARDYEVRADAAAAIARETAQRAEDAAERARNGEAGHRAFDYEHDPQLRRYEGEWSEEERASGLGVLTFGAGPYAGDRYAGAFRCGRKGGPGVYVHALNPGQSVAARYEGDYAEGDADRVGVFHGSSGLRHAGGSGDQAFNGPGVYYFPDGLRYEGEFAHNRPNGYGVLWTAEGRIRRSGIWTNGRLTTRLRQVARETAPDTATDAATGKAVATLPSAPSCRH